MLTSLEKSNSINPINHNLSFCEPKSSVSLVKLILTKTHFARETLDFGSQKLGKIVIDRVDGI